MFNLAFLLLAIMPVASAQLVAPSTALAAYTDSKIPRKLTEALEHASNPQTANQVTDKIAQQAQSAIPSDEGSAPRLWAKDEANSLYRSKLQYHLRAGPLFLPKLRRINSSMPRRIASTIQIGYLLEYSPALRRRSTRSPSSIKVLPAADWQAFVDQSNENYFVECFMPIVLRQDTRCYTLGHGGFPHRVFYVFSRGVVTRSNAGRPEPNYSEIIGAGASAGISNLYYPDAERTWTKTEQRWAINVGLDMMTLVFEEFWPDVNHKVLRKN